MRKGRKHRFISHYLKCQDTLNVYDVHPYNYSKMVSIKHTYSSVQIYEQCQSSSRVGIGQPNNVTMDSLEAALYASLLQSNHALGDGIEGDMK